MELPKRKSIRLKEFDYSSNGAYFVTICTQDREMLFGDIINGKMVLNKMGKIVDQAIQQTPEIRKNVQIDIYQIMPNHVHIIINIVGAYCNTPLRLDKYPQSKLFQSPSQTLGSIIRGIKSVTAKQIRITMDNPQFPVWQRNYYEHIIRNEKDLDEISQYIINNPLMWGRDRNNPRKSSLC